MAWSLRFLFLSAFFPGREIKIDKRAAPRRSGGKEGNETTAKIGNGQKWKKRLRTKEPESRDTAVGARSKVSPIQKKQLGFLIWTHSRGFHSNLHRQRHVSPTLFICCNFRQNLMDNLRQFNSWRGLTRKEDQKFWLVRTRFYIFLNVKNKRKQQNNKNDESQQWNQNQ